MSVNVMGVPISSSAVAIGLGTTATVVASYAMYRRMASRAKFEQSGKVKKLFIYPIKSVPPIELIQADITIHGMTYKNLRDREFMLLNPKQGNKFVTARDEPTLVLLEVTYNEEANCIEIASKNPEVPMQTLVISLEPVDCNSSNLLTVSTWKPQHAYKCLPLSEASEWFGTYLGKAVTLVRYVKQAVERRREVPDRFHDRAELNILSEKSVQNLNDLIRDPSTNVSYRNFRPSILLDVKMAFEEDYWASMKIGDVVTDFFQRCERCVFTTINPDTGVKTNKEPLTTLRRYRVDRSEEGITKHGLRPLLSVHHVIRRPGTIYVGQTIEAIRAPREML